MKALPRTLAALAGCTLVASASAWTDKPVKILVPAPAGGTADIVARVIGQSISTEIGKPVIIDNRPGASGGIAIQNMLNSPADGNTIMVAASNVLTEVPHVMKPPFDPLKDVVPLAVMGRSALVLVSSADYPAKDFNSMVKHLETVKGKSSYATYSAGTISQYAGQIFSDKFKLDMQHVPFPGSPPALQQLMAGTVDVMFDGLLTSAPQVKGGRLRAYAYSGPKRSTLLPDVPTVLELGQPELEFTGWVGVMGSAKLPPELRAKIQKVLEKVGQKPELRQKLVEAALEPEVSVDTAAIQRDDQKQSARYGAIVKKYNIKLN